MVIKSLLLDLSEIAMEFRLYEDDTVEEFLHDGVLVLVVRGRDPL